MKNTPLGYQNQNETTVVQDYAKDTARSSVKEIAAIDLPSIDS